jgi:hypothetical protein
MGHWKSTSKDWKPPWVLAAFLADAWGAASSWRGVTCFRLLRWGRLAGMLLFSRWWTTASCAVGGGGGGGGSGPRRVGWGVVGWLRRGAGASR